MEEERSDSGNPPAFYIMIMVVSLGVAGILTGLYSVRESFRLQRALSETSKEMRGLEASLKEHRASACFQLGKGEKMPAGTYFVSTGETTAQVSAAAAAPPTPVVTPIPAEPPPPASLPDPKPDQDLVPQDHGACPNGYRISRGNPGWCRRLKAPATPAGS